VRKYVINVMFCMFLDVCYVFLVNVIAFLGPKSQFPGLDRDSRFRPEYVPPA